MRPAIRFKLHFGPYRTPRFRYGQKVLCEVLGEMKIVRLSDAPIAWPMGCRRALVVYADLARAIHKESIVAIAHHWGVSTQTVTKWRRRLGIKGEPIGTSRLRSRYAVEPWTKVARRKAVSKARDPARIEKIAAAKRGKPRPAGMMGALRKANIGRKPSDEARRKMSIAQKARGAWLPSAGRSWEPWEDELMRTLPKKEVAAQTGRTLSAVKNRWHVLGVRGVHDHGTRAKGVPPR